MTRNRRRIFYVDRIFQKKLLVMFLGLNLTVVASNIIFYLFYLKSKIEGSFYRMHITISRINEVLSADVIRFNLILAVASIFCLLTIYFWKRTQTKRFFFRIGDALQTRMGSEGISCKAVKISEEFSDSDQILQDYFHAIDGIREEEKKRLAEIRKRLSELQGR